MLLLYSRGTGTNALTFDDSIDCFAAYSRHRIWPLDVYDGFPIALCAVRPAVIVLHHSVFYDSFGRLGERFLDYLKSRADAYLVAMFQDEQADLERRIAFCNEYAVDCIYTLFESHAAHDVYGANTPASAIVTHLPGYVSDRLRRAATELTKPDLERNVDIGYRGRKPPSDWGAAAMEKYEIGVAFADHAADLGLNLDIATDEAARIYGRDWYRFLGDCRATLGTESGTEVGFRGRTLPNRVVSPRHLEAAAMRSCQILFEGSYSGVLKPMIHFIPLKKDFSNFDQVIERYRDAEARQHLVSAAFRDLIACEGQSYRGFIAQFDQQLESAGSLTRPTSARGHLLSAVVRLPRPTRRWREALAGSAAWAAIRRRSAGT